MIMNHAEETIDVNQLVEGILYILAKPVSLTRLSSLAQIETKRVEEIIKRLQKKYELLNTPYMIEFIRNDVPDNILVELKLTNAGLEFLVSYDFVTTQELPAKYYQYMSTIMLLEYVKNKKITKKLLEKELKVDTPSLEKKLRILMQYGYITKKGNNYTTSDWFLRRMGLPTNKDSVRKAFKSKTIEYALEQFGFKNE